MVLMPLLQINHQGWLNPQKPLALSLHPVVPLPFLLLGHLGEAQVKAEEQLGKDEMHLGLGQVHSDAVARAVAERLPGAGRVVIVELGRPPLAPRQPALRDVLGGPGKVARRPVGHVLGHAHAGPLRQPDAAERVAALGRHTRREQRHRVVDADRLAQHGVHVRQRGGLRRRHRDLRLLGKGPPHLGGHFVQDPRVLQQEIDGAGQERGRGLGAGKDQVLGRALELVAGEALGPVLGVPEPLLAVGQQVALEQAVEEVAAVLAVLEPLADLVRDVPRVLGQAPEDVPG